jgi:hypothetical protein
MGLAADNGVHLSRHNNEEVEVRFENPDTACAPGNAY